MTHDTNRNEAIITYFGQSTKVACDRRCNKAWGINNRSRIQLSESEEDYAFLADDELGEAPVDPGTYEGLDAKPISPDEFPNKWCVRECERCASSAPGMWRMPLALRVFKERVYNKPQN
jgi:hypothetical protein